MSFLDIQYQVKRSTEIIAGQKIELECLENLDDTIDQVFKVLERTGNPQRLEELCPYFGVIWPAARGLAEYLAELPASRLQGKRVLELGCGLALPSLVAERRGASVLCTDFHPEVPKFLQRNQEINSSENLEYRSIQWEKENPSLEPFDWVIASDVLYERRFSKPLAEVFSTQLRFDGTAVLTDPGRPYLQSFADEMEKLGFQFRTQIKKVAQHFQERVQEKAQEKEIFILVFQRKTNL